MGVQTDMSTSLAIRSTIPNCGKSVLSFLLACRLSQILKQDMSILLCCACMQDGDVIDMIGNVEGYPTLEDLVNTAKTSANKDTDIKSLLYNTRNIFFIDSSKATPLFVKNNTVGYLNLMEYLKQQFDVIIIDTSSDSSNALTKLALEKCEYPLNVTVQDMERLHKSLFEDTRNLAYIINRYDNIYPDKKELSKLLKTRKLFFLPYCSQLQDMKNQKQLYRYAELETDYLKGIDKLADFLSKTLNLPKKERKTNRRFIQFLKKGDAK